MTAACVGQMSSDRSNATARLGRHYRYRPLTRYACKITQEEHTRIVRTCDLCQFEVWQVSPRYPSTKRP